jgi:[ribosomal protein S5]-alanine N-acetyltransferase
MNTVDVILETDRLYLREFLPGEGQLLVDLNSDTEVTRHTGDGAVSLVEAEDIILNTIRPQYKNKMGRWAVHLKGTSEFIGWSGIKYLESLDEHDLGYRFFKKHWGKGYATEAGKAVMQFGWNVLKLEKIVARASVDNTNSIKVLEKCGLNFSENGFEHGEQVRKFKAFSPLKH